MRALSTTIVCVAILLAANTAEAQGPNLANAIVEKYNKIAYFATPSMLSRCTSILHKRLGKMPRSADLVRITAFLAKVQKSIEPTKCLDTYSTLHAEGGGSVKADPTGGVQKPVVESGNILMIRVAAFRNAYGMLTSGVAELSPGWETRVSEVWINLRVNHGGYVDDLKYVLDKYFAPRAEIIYMRENVRGRVGQYQTTTTGKFAHLKFFLIVDRECASACEWFTATLRREWYVDKTTVYGDSTTFGKGISQCFEPIGGGVNIQITCGEFRPGGVKIQGVGITPDVRVSFDGCDENKTSCLIDKIRELQTTARTAAQSK